MAYSNGMRGGIFGRSMVCSPVIIINQECAREQINKGVQANRVNGLQAMTITPSLEIPAPSV